ncbi:hypothetical protein CVT24_009103 [Panaeolus cyanescens]|uniref:Uncharacterized protein n=1 Tax=Panaeolus cyanescens TaxID=181874 RepID=A0A409W3W4_9AGAR|nr:hypothetical protein CVT24_009103 [Panaeolus cyanescens]
MSSRASTTMTHDEVIARVASMPPSIRLAPPTSNEEIDVILDTAKDKKESRKQKKETKRGDQAPVPPNKFFLLASCLGKALKDPENRKLMEKNGCVVGWTQREVQSVSAMIWNAMKAQHAKDGKAIDAWTQAQNAIDKRHRERYGLPPKPEKPERKIKGKGKGKQREVDLEVHVKTDGAVGSSGECEEKSEADDTGPGITFGQIQKLFGLKVAEADSDDLKCKQKVSGASIASCSEPSLIESVAGPSSSTTNPPIPEWPSWPDLEPSVEQQVGEDMFPVERDAGLLSNTQEQQPLLKEYVINGVKLLLFPDEVPGIENYRPSEEYRHLWDVTDTFDGPKEVVEVPAPVQLPLLPESANWFYRSRITPAGNLPQSGDNESDLVGTDMADARLWYS